MTLLFDLIGFSGNGHNVLNNNIVVPHYAKGQEGAVW
jgi:hypothetical protein